MEAYQLQKHAAWTIYLMLIEKIPVDVSSCVFVVAAGIKSAGEPDDSGYHFVFMPSHLFPAYPSYRWWAVIVDRSVLMACLFKDHLLQSSLQQQAKSIQVVERNVTCVGPFGRLPSSRMFAMNCLLAKCSLSALQSFLMARKR